MVYCGKPSKGCSTCRERKIRCDQGEPSCGQCDKRRQVCPGYRNLVDLMIRNETSHVISKATRRRPHNPPRKSSTVAGPTSPSHPAKPKAQATITSSAKSDPKPNPAPTCAPQSTAPKRQYTTKPAVYRQRGTVLAALTPRSNGSGSMSSNESQDGDEDSIAAEAGDYSDADLLGDALSSSLQERGTAFFFSRYVAADAGCNQNYSFIYDVWKPPDSSLAQLDPVTLSMTAVGLAGLSQLPGCHETMTRARQSYALALQLTHACLRDPVEAVRDTTMLAVLILGTFEFISGRSPQTMRAWKDHVNGAAALASMRGSAQFGTRAGVRMFLMLSHSVLISCIQSNLPMPQAMIDLRNELTPEQEMDSPAWRFSTPIYKALQARHDITTGRLSDIDEIVSQLTDVDDEFSAILSELPPSWSYRRVRLTRPEPRVFGQDCLVYPGLTEATTWNGVRSIRMLVLEAILQQLYSGSDAIDVKSLPEHHRHLLARTIKLQEALGKAVVASLPQHFGIVSFHDAHQVSNEPVSVTLRPRHGVLSPPQAPGSRDDSPVTCPELPERPSRATLLDPAQVQHPQVQHHQDDTERFMTLASASHTIIWPLYILGFSSSCSTDTRQYAIKSLHAIHQETGLEQAKVVAGLLQAKVESTVPTLTLLEKLPTISDGWISEMVT